MSSAAEEAKALVDLGRSVVERANDAGADVAEAGVHSGSHLSVKVRMGEPELVEEAGSRALGLRVMVGQRVASTYTSDLSEAGQRTLIEDALQLARLSEPDEFAGPPDRSELSSQSQWEDLDTFDEGVSRISADEALDRAMRGERAAFDFDPRITNSEGASFTRARGMSALVTSGGFAGSDYGTYASIVVNPVADDEGGKKRSGYHWSASRHYEDLESSPARRSFPLKNSRSSSTKPPRVRSSVSSPDASSVARFGGKAPTWSIGKTPASQAIWSTSSTTRCLRERRARAPSTARACCRVRTSSSRVGC
jgi:PmbA protein